MSRPSVAAWGRSKASRQWSDGEPSRRPPPTGTAGGTDSLGTSRSAPSAPAPPPPPFSTQHDGPPIVHGARIAHPWLVEWRRLASVAIPIPGRLRYRRAAGPGGPPQSRYSHVDRVPARLFSPGARD